MQRVQPLRDTHPQFSTFKTPSYHEFKLENWKLAGDGSGKVIRPHPELYLALGIPVLAWLYQRLAGGLQYVGLAVGLWLLGQSVFLNVSHESLVVYPPHGVQVETHRGFRNCIFSSSRTFIPFTVLQDIVINEGLYGWNVRYYIVALTRPRNSDTVLKVVFPNLLPHFPILKIVYNEIQMYLPQNKTESAQ